MSEWDFLWEDGLSQEEIMEAMASGGTQADWDYIERMEREEYGDFDDYYDDEPYRKANTMIYVDAESVPYKCVENIQSELQSIGKVAEARFYAMQKDDSTKAWRNACRQYGYKAILMSGEPQKNKIDNKIIRDAKKVLNENKSIDIFCIATRDGDYKELVDFLRKNGKRVVILAPQHTSKKLKKAGSESRFIR